VRLPRPGPVTACFLALGLAIVGVTALSAQRPRPRAAGTGARTLDAALPAVERWVAADRRLEFTGRVQAEFLDDAAFDERVRSLLDDSSGGETRRKGTARTAASPGGYESTLRALGLLTGADPASSSATSDALAGILGLYVPEERLVLVRGTAVTPYRLSVLAHELVHALQDQHVAAVPLAERMAISQRLQGLRTVVEGDAERVRQDYVATLSRAERASYDADERAQPAPSGPDAVETTRLARFPYDEGARFTRALLAAGGQRGLDAAFTDPPTTTAQVLHPDRYLDRARRSVYLPAAPEVPLSAAQDVVDGGHALGEQVLRQALGERLTVAEAAAVLAPMRGDAYVTWRPDAGPACVRDVLEFDGAPAVRTADSALRRWLGPKADLTPGPQPDQLTFTRCAPDAT